MPLRAYHRLILPDGTTESLSVVRFDDEGCYLSHHPLSGEEPFVEWVGGTLDLRTDHAHTPSEPLNNDLCQEKEP
jgi:hypothetical protein